MNDEQQVRDLLHRAADSIEPGPVPPLVTRQPTRARALTVLGSAAAVLAVVGSAYVASRPSTAPVQPSAPDTTWEPSVRTVPDVVGLEKSDALERLTSADLTARSDPDQEAPEVACGAVVTWTTPEAGASASVTEPVFLRLAHTPCAQPVGELTGDLRALEHALRNSQLDDVRLAQAVTLTQEGGRDTRLTGGARRDPTRWVVRSSNRLLPLAGYDSAVVDGTPLNCTGSVEQLPEGETSRPAISFLHLPGVGDEGEGESCLAWSAVDVWLDEDSAVRHVHLRTWE